MLERGSLLKKRSLLLIAIMSLMICSVLGYAYFIEPNRLVVTSVTVETDKSIKPLTVVFFTDTHFGAYYDVTHVKKIVNTINEASPDLVVFGGDLFDHYARDRDDLDLDYLKEELRRINAKVNKYAVRGNHDYGGGAVRIYEDFITSCGFELLDNQSVVLEQYGIEIIGYDDYLMGISDPSQYKLDGALFNLIIAHEPITASFIESKSDNLLLTGHTHGGQVSIPFITSKLLPEGSGNFVKGFYTREELNRTISLRMYTSSGIGMTRYPFRFLNTPEIVEIKLQTADQGS